MEVSPDEDVACHLGVLVKQRNWELTTGGKLKVVLPGEYSALSPSIPNLPVGESSLVKNSREKLSGEVALNVSDAHLTQPRSVDRRRDTIWYNVHKCHSDRLLKDYRT